MTKFYVISGEASGDIHGAKLIEQLLKSDIDISIRAWGGENIENLDIPVDKNIKDLAFMGFVEVAKNLRKIMQNFKDCKRNILSFKPDAIILIDYPGFNLRIAKWAKKKGIKVFYFISPGIWAWNTKRVYSVKKYVDKMYVILPFEKHFYKKYGVDVEYYGNPLAETVHNYSKPYIEKFCATNNLSGKPIIALLPGSRNQEVKKILPVMLEVAKYFADYEFVIAASNNVSDTINRITANKELSNVKIISNNTYDVLAVATAGLIKSGTSTLEAALFELPQVVCYKGGSLSVAIAKVLAKVNYISLVNIIANRPVVKELIQNELNVENAKNELSKIIEDKDYVSKMTNDYKNIKSDLYKPNTYKSIASSILEKI